MKNVTFTEIKNACKDIADKIKSENHEKITIVAVARGGLVPATIIAHLLGIKDIRFIRLSSYANDHQQSELIDTTFDEIPNAETTYIIDENGFIEKVMPKVKPDTNAAEILTYLCGEE